MTYRSILGVSENATPEEIRRAYLAKVKQVHPDNGGSKSSFIKVHEAYCNLIDKSDSSSFQSKSIEMKQEEESSYWPIIQLMAIFLLFLMLTLKYCAT